MYNTGQSCCSVERIYVHDQIHDAVIDAFVRAVEGMKAGDPMDEDTYIGAITRAPQLAVLEAQVTDALELGATLHIGGRRLPGPGNWYAPTVFSNVDRMALRQKRDSADDRYQKSEARGSGEADERHPLRPTAA